MFSPAIQRLIDQFARFPTVGPRTAARFVFYLQNLSLKETGELLEAIRTLKEKIAPCYFCFNPFEKRGGDSELDARYNLCAVCASPKRDFSTLCVVEKPTDLEAIERTKQYKGVYFVLGGTVGKLRKKDLEKLRIKELKDRIASPQKFGLKESAFGEIIIATNATTEGESTAMYLQRELKALGVKMTRLGRGLPLGGELEYADEETLAGALDNRK